ncbi:siderophore-interacting protein [Sinomonas cyclohexanicum]|uniref:Siderophore-interacting protein n=1 Tax=Sinomonas cyclohexanicum TaxID=322009 RepID=A0ABN6FLC1_SINCY|nr:GAF domain-containing protein [Corynebacterium cyclohexanicum]BCT77439.1 siderophore-interacting protein [Corynebacterium cyclohexanicum]
MDRLDRQVQIAVAREQLLRNARADTSAVSDLVAASWRRSVSAGVGPNDLEVGFHADIDTGSRLVRCAQPVLDRLHDETSDLSLVIALTDNRARILSRTDTSTQAAAVFDGINFAPGFDYAEHSLGTNGVGSALESAQPVSIVGTEHFHERLQAFACTGAPVLDPVSGRIEGVLDLSLLSQHWSPVLHSLVRAAAHDISRNLLIDRSQSQQALFETYVRADARTRHPVLAFGESVEIANAVAQLTFTPQEREAIADHARFLFTGRDRASDSIVLESGTVVRLHGTRIMVGMDVAGVVVVAEVRPEATALPRVALADRVLPAPSAAVESTRAHVAELTAGPAARCEGRNLAWVRAIEEIRATMAERRPLLVKGETGVGKFSAVIDQFHLLIPAGRSLSFDAPSFDSDAYEDMDLDALLAADTTLCVFRNIDELSGDGVERLEAFLSRLTASGRGVQIAATLSGAALESGLPFSQILHLFDAAVTLPPIRFRSEDIPDMANRLVATLAPGRDVRIGPEAMAVIRRYTWPRNLTQLSEALAHALSRRPAGTMTREDLPAYCYSHPRRQLTHLEQTERDAIVAALQALGGTGSRPLSTSGCHGPRSTGRSKGSRS